MSDQKTELRHLMLDLERSARYHSMRGHFLRNRHTFLIVTMIAISGTSVFGLAEILSKFIAGLSTNFGPTVDLTWFDADAASTLIGFAVAGIGAYDLLGRFSSIAGEHLSYEKVYNDMLAEANQLDESDEASFRRLKFRADAVSMTSEGMYRAVNAIAHNQVMISHGYNNRLRVAGWVRFLANYLAFSSMQFTKDSQDSSRS